MEKNQLIFDDKDRPGLIVFYESQLKEVEKERKRILDKLNQLKGDLKPTNQVPIRDESINIDSGYNKDWKWEDKITFGLKEIKRSAQKSEIFDKLLEYEPELNNKDVRSGNRNSVGATLSRLSNPKSKYRVYGKIEKLGSRALYALLEWFDENEILKRHFEKNESLQVAIL